LQLQQLLGSMWNRMVTDISEGSGLYRAELDSIANSYGAYNSIHAKQLGMIHDLKYEDEMLEYIREKAGVEEGKELNLIPVHNYYQKIEKKAATRSDNEIAIVY